MRFPKDAAKISRNYHKVPPDCIFYDFVNKSIFLFSLKKCKNANKISAFGPFFKFLNRRVKSGKDC